MIDLPSQFQPGDELTLKVKVHGVIFTDAKVNYLVEDKCGEVHRIDSCAIHYLIDDEPAAHAVNSPGFAA